MRSFTGFFAVFASLSLLSACDSIEKKVEQKAEQKAEGIAFGQTSGKSSSTGNPMLSGMGGVVTLGMCPNWPASVPIYPNAKNFLCQDLDSKKVAESPAFKMYEATQSADDQRAVQEGIANHDKVGAYFALTYSVDGKTNDDIDAFYRAHLSGSIPPPPVQSPFPMTPLLAREPTAKDPLMSVFSLHGFDAPAGMAQVTIIVAVEERL